jgi:hypothetical protein
VRLLFESSITAIVEALENVGGIDPLKRLKDIRRISRFGRVRPKSGGRFP